MNILDQVAIRVRCGVCSGEYDVPASVVVEGQQAILHGCPGCSDYECEARFVASLADSQALSALQTAWAAFEASVTAHGGAGIILVGLPPPRSGGKGPPVPPVGTARAPAPGPSASKPVGHADDTKAS